MISRAGDSIWAHGANGRGPDPSALSKKDEMARRRREWELRGEQKRREWDQHKKDMEALDKEWSKPEPEPTDPFDIGQLLDREYARHQRRNRGWDFPWSDPTPIDNSLPREEWDERVRSFLKNPVRSRGSVIASDPHAMVGEDAFIGVRDALMKAHGGDVITPRGAIFRMRKHYGMDGW